MSDIEIFSRPGCGYCEMAKRLLERRGMEYSEIDVSVDRGALADMIGRSGGRMTFPQIFIRGRHIGGFDELAGLDRRGALDELLAA